ncbi:MAG TPA: transposase [Candidatus Sumerlaeota bacterium]|nr:transposase [Candidatus Sumerlaeota bacterium]
MARPKRIDLPHCLYHVISRTNSGDIAFRDTLDRRAFLKYLAKYLKMFECRIHAYCLMDTHFHLLLESGPRACLSELMRRLLTAYTAHYNRRHNRHGHLFQGRFKSLVVDKSGYFLTVSRYIHLNPARDGAPGEALDYPGSSLRYYAGGGEPDFLETSETLQWFEGDRAKYVQYVLEGLNDKTFPPVLQQRYIGNETFGRRLRRRLGQAGAPRARQADVKRRESLAEKGASRADAVLAAVAGHYGVSERQIRQGWRLGGKTGAARKSAAVLLVETLPWTHRDVAEYLGLDGSNTVSYHLRTAAESRSQQDSLDAIRKHLSK